MKQFKNDLMKSNKSELEELLFEKMQESYMAKMKELPSPPPGYFYKPTDYDIKHVGEEYIITTQLELKPIIDNHGNYEMRNTEHSQ